MIPVTVSVTVVVCTVLPAVPVTVMGYVPSATDEPTVMLIAELPAPVIDVGLKLTVTPAGCPEALSTTGVLNPPVTELVMVELPALPCTTETDDGEADRLKPG